MSNTAKATLWIMVATMFSKVLGFIREMVLGSFYGTSYYADMFLLTLNIPGLIVAVVGSAIATTYIPMYFETKKKQGDEGGLRFTNNVLNISLVISLIIAILGMTFTEELVKIFAFGYKGQELAEAVKFTRIMISGVVFLGLSKIIASYLQANDNFTIPALIGIPYNIIIVTSIILSTKTDVSILAYGALLAMASQLLFQIPFAFKKSFKYKPYLNIKDESFKELLVLVAPMLIGVAIGQLNVFVDKALATTLDAGRLSALNYAARLNDFIMAIFVTSIITVIYPKLAKMSNSNEENSKGNFINTVVKTSNCITLFVLPIAVGAIILSEPIVRILFERGAFDEMSTQMTSIALKLYSVGLLAVALRDILYRVFYSMSDTKTPMINGSISLIINIVLNIVLIKPLGFIGLAISTSIASIITVILCFITLKKKTGYFGGDKIIKTILKSFVASIIMAVVVVFVYNNLYTILGIGTINEIVSVAISVILGATVYAVIIYILKIEEVRLIVDMINKVKRSIQNKMKKIS